MNDMTRRDALKAGAATVGAALLPSNVVRAASTWNGPAPEPGAQIRVLRWKQFIQSEFDSFAANTKKFVEQTASKYVSTPKAGMTSVQGRNRRELGDRPGHHHGHERRPVQIPRKAPRHDRPGRISRRQYGGWHPVTRKYGMLRDQWIALPQGSPVGTYNYRISAMRAAGFDEFPKDTAGFLKLCQGLKKVGKPPGFALGHATGDANGWTHWCLWAHGGKMVDDSNNVVLDSPRPSPPLNTPCNSMRTSSKESCRGSTRATTRRFFRTRSASQKTAFRSTPSPGTRQIPRCKRSLPI